MVAPEPMGLPTLVAHNQCERREAQDRARTGAARAGAETSDEDFHRTGSRFEPEGERARQAAGEDYGRPAESEYAAEHESARTA